MPDALSNLAAIIQQGLPGPEGGVRAVLAALFGGRYQSRYYSSTRDSGRDVVLRDAYSLGNDDRQQDGVPYAGLIHPENPESGPYGGTSLVWFPTRDCGSILSFVVGTRGLPPDEGILTRPGHRRRIAALRRHLARKGIATWSKPDPADLGAPVPKMITGSAAFAGFERAFQRYGSEMYCIARVPDDPDLARLVVQACFDLYAYERGWQVLASWREEFAEFDREFRADLFPNVTEEQVSSILLQRRFVVLQGSPGTGKTRLAQRVWQGPFQGNGMLVQFHPAVTYEDFVVGLSPDPGHDSLRFVVRPGWLLQAVRAAEKGRYLLVIDEVNRADLGKVLGEAIYLFEAGEIGGTSRREVRLPHAVDGQLTLSLPENLYVLATMNTADRSIATMDLAIRRRFAFVTMHSDSAVVAQQQLDLATDIFNRLTDVFVEHAPDDALDPMPGHAYFLAGNEQELQTRLRFELLPLLDEYLREGLLGAASAELHAVRDLIENSAS